MLSQILKNIRNDTDIISTTGFTSREVHQLRMERGLKKGKDFYMVGAMGHSSMVTLGNSIFKKNTSICLDGDGAALMHLGALTMMSNYGKKNLKYILLNNSSHESSWWPKNTSFKNRFLKRFQKHLNLKNTLCLIQKKILISN